LLEAIGIKPVIQMVQGHIFVGWHASDKDPFKAKLTCFFKVSRPGSNHE
jgi:hypothetical protein